MTEHTPPTAAQIAANLTASTRKHCTSCADRPRMCPRCDLYDDGVTDMLTALEVAGLLPDENGISHTEPAALPEEQNMTTTLATETTRSPEDIMAEAIKPYLYPSGKYEVLTAESAIAAFRNALNKMSDETASERARKRAADRDRHAGRSDGKAARR